MARQSHIQFSIPEPCTVPWEGMSPVDSERRHCFSCDKVITNFSGMSDDELVLYFKHSHGKICGLFANDQLNRRIKLLPEKTQKAGWWRMMLLIPLSFFSKSAKAQTDSVSVKEDSIQSNQQIVGTNTDSIQIIDSTKISSADPIDSLIAEDSNVKEDTILSTDPNPPEIIFGEGSGVVYGSVLETMGICYNPIVPWETVSFWGRLFPTWRKLKKNEQQIDNPNPYKAIADQPEKKPEPKAPAMPASNEISGIMPEERKKLWRS